MAEVEETVKRIASHKGVTGIVILNSDGIPIKSTLDAPTTVQLAASIQNLCTKGRNCIREMDPTNDLTFLRLRSRKHEIMCAPEGDYMMVVIQNPEK
ncbi:dynein light chain roadblock-type 1-like [Pomacea canaliculata]|uniref:dynein light chain roadblock-type 1-like n=1 Tax=Pomacea canaliculata TaxID=400727 RepID=UPI000D726419|nr:dynein light chain roadblock-type 1-like [Pomacea canaliculata]